MVVSFGHTMCFMWHPWKLIQDFLWYCNRVLKQWIIFTEPCRIVVLIDRIWPWHLLALYLIVIWLSIVVWCLLRDILRKILHSNGRIHRSPIILHLRYLTLHALIHFISRSKSYVLKGEVVMCALCITMLMVSTAIENSLNSFMRFLLLFACRLSFWRCPFSRMCGFIFAFSFFGFLIFTTFDSFYFLGNLS